MDPAELSHSVAAQGGFLLCKPTMVNAVLASSPLRKGAYRAGSNRGLAERPKNNDLNNITLKDVVKNGSGPGGLH